jgi:hypothetical protein
MRCAKKKHLAADWEASQTPTLLFLPHHHARCRDALDILELQGRENAEIAPQLPQQQLLPKWHADAVRRTYPKASFFIFGKQA